MSKDKPTARVITITCANSSCGLEYEVEGSYDYQTYMLRLKHAVCPKCGTARDEEIIHQYFQCKAAPKGCNVIYRHTRTFRPKDGLCPACYMRNRRKAGNANNPEG